MTRLAQLHEYKDIDDNFLPHIKFLDYDAYIKQGGSEEYIKYLCNSTITPKPGWVFYIPLIKGFGFWRKFYRIWVYMRDPWTFEFYGTKEEALNQQTLREELVRSRYWIQQGKNTMTLIVPLYSVGPLYCVGSTNRLCGLYGAYLINFFRNGYAHRSAGVFPLGR